MQEYRLILFSLSLASILSCGDGYDSDASSQPPTPGEPSAPADETGAAGNQPGATRAPVSFSMEVQPIFSSNCALAGCHTGASPTAGQDLSAGKAFGAIAGVAARSSCVGQLKVNPGNPDGSVLVKKIEGTTCGSRMPLGRNPLGSDQIALIRAWIQEGAQNN